MFKGKGWQVGTETRLCQIHLGRLRSRATYFHHVAAVMSRGSNHELQTYHFSTASAGVSRANPQGFANLTCSDVYTL
jgi:hypothetical protein